MGLGPGTAGSNSGLVSLYLVFLRICEIQGCSGSFSLKSALPKLCSVLLSHIIYL